MKYSRKGFTLIELLVVIAIIGILSAVVLASLNSARNKGSDAAIKSTINNMRAQAALYYDGTGNQQYDTGTNNVCTGGMFACAQTDCLTTLVTGATNAGGTLTCHSATSSYAISSLLKSGQYYCVDGNGFATTSVGNNISTAGDTDCK
jgi:prepilin-type N-terminal cleavage/methylation domain-containing protein